MHQFKTLKRVLKRSKKDLKIVKKYVHFCRTYNQTSRKLFKNLIRDCHCYEDTYKKLVEFAHKRSIKPLIIGWNYTRLRDKFNEFCDNYKIDGNLIKLDNWGDNCYRVVCLRDFANQLRLRILKYFKTLEVELGKSGRNFIHRTSLAPAVSTDEQAIRFMKELKAIPVKDRLIILSVINLSKRDKDVVWTSTGDEIFVAFASQKSDLVREVILRLGINYLNGRVLLFKYSLADLNCRDIQLHFPTPFDVGWDQGNFVPSKCDACTGWTSPLPPMQRGFPEGVHKNSNCVFVDPSLPYC